MKTIFLYAAMALSLTACGPGFLAAATAVSGFDAVVNIIHDGPDLNQCGKLLDFLSTQPCPKADTKTTDAGK